PRYPAFPYTTLFRSYEATWNPTADNYYELTAVATNDKGLYTRSRVVLAQVGDLFGGMKTFTNANGTFEQLAEGKYLITSGGANRSEEHTSELQSREN